MTYPYITHEFETIKAIQAGASIARFGDGEFKLALGRKCVSQDADPMLQRELIRLLSFDTECLIALPNIHGGTPKFDFWKGYDKENFNQLYKPDKRFYSSFITRPDSAPWIDTPEYWEQIRGIWKNRHVTLVRGSDNSLTRADLVGAHSVQEIIVPAKNAFADIDHIQAIIIKTNLVILCCGATATVLAARLAEKGTQALDLGHIGMFMRSPGSFNFYRHELITDSYLQQNIALHNAPEGFGGSGHKQEPDVRKFALDNGYKSILDYGCGVGTLKKKLKENGWDGFIGEYDPAIPGKEMLPKPADLVTCTDVLEHIEPEKLDRVLEHIYGLVGRGCYLNIALRPANKTLPDGRNAHLIIEHSEFWLEKLRKYDWLISSIVSEGHSMKVWLKK